MRCWPLRVGQTLAARQVPFSRVLASEMCRGFRTAELLNLGPAIEQRPERTCDVSGNVQNRCNEMRTYIARAPDAGTNVALVGHSAITGDSTFVPTVDSALCSTLDSTGRSNRPGPAGAFGFGVGGLQRPIRPVFADELGAGGQACTAEMPGGMAMLGFRCCRPSPSGLSLETSGGT